MIDKGQALAFAAELAKEDNTPISVISQEMTKQHAAALAAVAKASSEAMARMESVVSMMTRSYESMAQRVMETRLVNLAPSSARLDASLGRLRRDGVASAVNQHSPGTRSDAGVTLPEAAFDDEEDRVVPVDREVILSDMRTSNFSPYQPRG